MSSTDIYTVKSEQARHSRLVVLFNELDKDKSGSISADELLKYFKELGIAVSEEEVHSVLENVEKQKNGQLDFSEFTDLMATKRLISVFNEVDTDNSGSIDRSELRLAFKKLGFEPNDKQLREMIRHVDQNNDGVIDFEEFCKFTEIVPFADLQKVIQYWVNTISFDIGSDLAPSHPVANLTLFTAGAVGGTVSRTAIAPLTLVSIRAQATSTGSATQICKDIFKETGIKGFFKGNGVSILRVVPFGGIVCLAYRNILEAMPTVAERWEPMKRLAAGAISGMLATIPVYPLDLVRARLSVGSQTSATQIVKQKFQAQGISGLYRGLGPTLLAIGPFIAIQQTTYDMLKRQTQQRLDIQPSFSLLFGFGVCAGLAAQSVVHPIDLIRRRKQLEGTGTSADRTSNSWAACRSIIQSSGVRGLFRGLIPACLKIIPAVSIGLIVRDSTLEYLDK